MDMWFGISNTGGMKYIWVGCDSETNEKHDKDCNQEWFLLVTAKLDRNWIRGGIREGMRKFEIEQN